MGSASEGGKIRATDEGAFASGSALTQIIKGKTLEQTLKFNEMDIMDYLEGIPDQKIHCAILAVRTLEKAINQYLEKG